MGPQGPLDGTGGEVTHTSGFLPRTSIRTYSGKHLDLANPDPDDILIEDIAIGLARECRYARQSNIWYSVAEHSWLVANACRTQYPTFPAAQLPELQLRALLHDASEAYLGDLPGPIKQTDAMAGFRAVEGRLQTAIYQAFGLVPNDDADGHWHIVHKIDTAIRSEEMRRMWARPERAGYFDEGTFGVQGVPMERANQLFLDAFNLLNLGDPFYGFDDGKLLG